MPDHIYTLKQYVVDAGEFPNIAAFKAKYNGWNDGVNKYNGRVSSIYLSVFSDVKQGNTIAPNWSKISRQLIFPSASQFKNLKPYGKYFCSGFINKGGDVDLYHKPGAQTYLFIGDTTPQLDVFSTVKSADANVTTDGLYSLGQHIRRDRMAGNPRCIITSEIGENTQGGDDDIYGKMESFYRGSNDILVGKGFTDVRQHGDFGDYGDDYYGLFNEGLLFTSSRADFEKSLTTHVHNTYSVDGFGGINEFYSRNHIRVRNLNHKIYMENSKGETFFPYQLLYINERAKVGTKTYENQDRERDVLVFSWPYCQTLQTD